jgi:hypothetical protein
MPSDPKVSDLQFYEVHPGRPVTLRIEIGNEMVGGPSIMFEGPPQPVQPEQDIRIGAEGEDLRFRILHTVTTVQDTNPNTNTTLVTFHLRGGVADRSLQYTLTLSEAGGLAFYLIDFAFV